MLSMCHCRYLYVLHILLRQELREHPPLSRDQAAAPGRRRGRARRGGRPVRRGLGGLGGLGPLVPLVLLVLVLGRAEAAEPPEGRLAALRVAHPGAVCSVWGTERRRGTNANRTYVLGIEYGVCH